MIVQFFLIDVFFQVSDPFLALGDISGKVVHLFVQIFVGKDAV